MKPESPRRHGYLLALIMAGILTATASVSIAQDRGRDRSEGRRDSGGGRDSRDRGGERESRDRGDERSGHRDEARSRFTRSAEGRRFENGVALRPGTVVVDRHYDRYFPSRTYSFPHYAYSREAAVVVASPFHYYYGVYPPYIERSHIFVALPPRIFIDVPIYVNNSYHGYSRDDDYYLRRSSEDSRWKDDPDLRRGVYDLEDAFRNDDISLLSALTDPHEKIAIFARGRYQYSVEPGDYLDMTRDFMRTSRTTDFNAYRVHYKRDGVYQVFAKHMYRDPDDRVRTVYLCMVMERISGRWTLTQVDTSPDVIRQ